MNILSVSPGLALVSLGVKTKPSAPTDIEIVAGPDAEVVVLEEDEVAVPVCDDDSYELV